MTDPTSTDVLDWRFPETAAHRRSNARWLAFYGALAAVGVAWGVVAGEVRGTVALVVIALVLVWLNRDSVARTRRFRLRVTDQRELVVTGERGDVRTIPTWGARRIQARSAVNNGVPLASASTRWVVVVATADGSTHEVDLPAFARHGVLEQHEVAELVRHLRWWAGLVSPEPLVAAATAASDVAAPSAAAGVAAAPVGAAAPAASSAGRLLGVPLEWRHPQADSTRRGLRWVWGTWLLVVLGVGLAAALAEGIVAALLAMAVIGGFTLLIAAPLTILLANVSRFVLRVDETGTCSMVVGRRVRHTCALRGAIDVRVVETAHSTTTNTGAGAQQRRTSSCAVVVTAPDGAALRMVIPTSGGFATVSTADQAQLEAELRSRAGLAI
ncbi:MAG TPA: hypothetical protein VK866_16865 [Acidimicrobiales bacterium]|nr:hypothetical protein [Acidimicrobiales bacterium]